MKRTVLLIALALVGAGCSSWKPADKSKEIRVSVTENGFEPSVIQVKKGTVVTLLMTRRTDQTCATEVVVPDRGIHQALPLNQPVRLAIGPVEGGEIAFTCGMEMVKGKVVAQ